MDCSLTCTADVYSFFFFIACSRLQERREREVPIEGYAD